MATGDGGCSLMLLLKFPLLGKLVGRRDKPWKQAGAGQPNRLCLLDFVK